MTHQSIIRQALNSTVDHIEFTHARGHHSGKVRESFVLDEARRAIVVTDRISAFDFILGTVPFKGQVLNQIAAWWFRKLDGIVPHHFIESPDPNISLVRNAKPLPVEIIVRGYLTGTTKTSSWYAYQNLDRKICGLTMPKGMVKNQKFPKPIVTPTTKGGTRDKEKSSIFNLQSSMKGIKDGGMPRFVSQDKQGTNMHDEPVSREEIIARGLVPEKIWDQAEEYAMKMFLHGQRIAAERGLILVDTKYEMGMDNDGNLIVIDEVHTPDSSRYWKQSSIFNLQWGKSPHSSRLVGTNDPLCQRGQDAPCYCEESRFIERPRSTAGQAPQSLSSPLLPSVRGDVPSGSRGTEGFRGNEGDFELTSMLGSDGEPLGLDKEFVRRMIVGKGYNVDDPNQNPSQFLDDELRVSASEKYIELFETMTGESFQFPKNLEAEKRIEKCLKGLA